MVRYGKWRVRPFTPNPTVLRLSQQVRSANEMPFGGRHKSGRTIWTVDKCAGLSDAWWRCVPEGQGDRARVDEAESLVLLCECRFPSMSTEQSSRIHHQSRLGGEAQKLRATASNDPGDMDAKPHSDNSVPLSKESRHPLSHKRARPTTFTLPQHKRVRITINQERPTHSIQTYGAAKLDIKERILADVLRTLQEVKPMIVAHTAPTRDNRTTSAMELPSNYKHAAAEPQATVPQAHTRCTAATRGRWCAYQIPATTGWW